MEEIAAELDINLRIQTANNNWWFYFIMPIIL